MTLFDEPYAGLDAVTRQIFYDRLLADYADFPRTVLLSTHLIDEAAALFENVVVIDRGRVVLDAAADGLRGMTTTVSGPVLAVNSFTEGRPVWESARTRFPGVRRHSRADISGRPRAGPVTRTGPDPAVPAAGRGAGVRRVGPPRTPSTETASA